MKSINADYEQFERDFYRDIRRKKRIASNVHKMRGKRGYVGKVITTMDLLEDEEKKEYIKAGKVVMWNMYKDLMPMEELETYTKYHQKNILKAWHMRFTPDEIKEGLGVSDYRYKSKLEKLDLNASNMMDEFEIISYQDWKDLPEEEKFYAIDRLTKLFKTRALAERWGVTNKTISQSKYQAKKYLKDNHLPLERPDDWEPLEVVLGERNPKVDNSMNLYRPDIETEELKVDKEPSEGEISDADKISDMQKEIDALREKVDAQATNEAEGSEETHLPTEGKFTLNVPHVHTMNGSTGDSVAIEPIPHEQVNGMTFNYQDQKEGFLLHVDIERFITMLKKNPDKFRVEMKITRVDD